MQFLSISEDTKLSDLSSLVGAKNVETVLATNGLSRTPNIGKALYSKCEKTSQDYQSVPWQQKCAILNSIADYDDLFEKAALQDESEWKVLANQGTFSGMLKLPESVVLPFSYDVIGQQNHVDSLVYNRVIESITVAPHTVDPTVFSKYSSSIGSSADSAYKSGYSSDLFQWFNIPWGDVTLHSSIDRTSISIPAYPEELSDSYKANYSQMPDMLFQYEPWQVYESSGPRVIPFTFKLHRHMWTGDHNDGKANELIRFCQSMCYADYQGSAVNTAIATMYIKGKSLISGILTDVNIEWSGPLADDGWYLYFELSFNITEVSQIPLNYATVKNKGLIG